MKQPIYIIDGARTPFLKARNAPGPFAASDMATAAGSALLARQRFLPEQLDEVILGCASPSPDEVNIGRVVALRLGCGDKVPGWTVMRNCASGMQALDSAIANIQCGRSQLVLAGGVDALSHAPLLFSDKMVRWLAGWYAARTTGARCLKGSDFSARSFCPTVLVANQFASQRVMASENSSGACESASTPPASTRSERPRRILAAAESSACMPEAQLRITVHPGTASPQPMRSATTRPMLTSSAAGLAQPRITSSSCSGAKG